MSQEGAQVLRDAMAWLVENVADPTQTTVGYICNRLGNKLVHKAVMLVGQSVQYVHPVSKLIEALQVRLARMA